jgi:hypothetical protein
MVANINTQREGYKMIHDVKHLLRQPLEPKYNLAERVLFIGGGVMFCFAFACGLLGVGL